MSGGKMPTKSTRTAVVARSPVPTGLSYHEYRQPLRRDFFFCCGYCTVSEAEAGGVRFTIDHYEPRNARPDLKDEYGNLMYSCDTCNMLKGDRTPPERARAEGYRFFHPDTDTFSDHYDHIGIRVEPRTRTGEFTTDALDLNRLALRRVRGARERLGMLGAQVVEGVRSLRHTKLDKLPPTIRGRVLIAIKHAEETEQRIAEAIDFVLSRGARSPLLDEDPESKERAGERAERLKQIESLFPEAWRPARKSKDSTR